MPYLTVTSNQLLDTAPNQIKILSMTVADRLKKTRILCDGQSQSVACEDGITKLFS